MANLGLLLALLCAVAMAFVLVPLWRYRVREAASGLEVRAAKNRELFAQRQLELEQEVREGTIAAEDHQRMLAELQRAFLTDMQALETEFQSEKVPQSANKLRWLPVLLALLIPVGALLIYRQEGSAPDLALPAILQKVSNAADKDAQTAALGELADFLQQRLERRADDLENGYMLGTLYLGIDRYGDAAKVFEKMLTTMKPTPDRATVLGQLAQARYLQADSSMTPEVQEAMDEALALNPNEQAVMSLAAIDAFVKQDYVTALKYWRRQLSDLTPGSQAAEQLRQRITTIEANLPADQVAAAKGPTISVVIDIAPELAAKITPNMRLFVYARSPAMPMPIVADNQSLPEFPFTLTLDNSLSMTGMQLESVPQLIVGARLSASGNPLAASGDLQVLSTPFVLSDQHEPIKLTINSVVP